MFKIPLNKARPSTWRTPIPSNLEDDHVYISVEFEGMPNGFQLSGLLPRARLLNNVPGFNKFLSDDGKTILLPKIAEEISDTALDNIVAAVLNKTGRSAQLEMSIDACYMAIVEHHVVFAILGMEKECLLLEDKLWYYLQIEELSLQTVTWAWETFGHFLDAPQTGGGYVPPHAALYINGMAYQILNLKAIEKLNPLIEELVCGDKPHSQYRLRQILDERLEKWGLEKGYKKEEELEAAVALANLASAKESPLTEVSAAVVNKDTQTKEKLSLLAPSTFDPDQVTGTFTPNNQSSGEVAPSAVQTSIGGMFNFRSSGRGIGQDNDQDGDHDMFEFQSNTVQGSNENMFAFQSNTVQSSDENMFAFQANTSQASGQSAAGISGRKIRKPKRRLG